MCCEAPLRLCVITYYQLLGFITLICCLFPSKSWQNSRKSTNFRSIFCQYQYRFSEVWKSLTFSTQFWFFNTFLVPVSLLRLAQLEHLHFEHFSHPCQATEAFSKVCACMALLWRV